MDTKLRQSEKGVSQMKKNSCLNIMKRVYQQDLKLQFNSTFLYCYETMNTLIISGYFVSHPLQKHICAHYLWSKDNIIASYHEPIEDNTYCVNITRINTAIYKKLQEHSIAFLLRPNDTDAQEEAEEFKTFIDEIYFYSKRKTEMACVPTLQKYLMKTNLESYPLTECINELKMMQMLSDSNIDSYIKKFCDLDKLAYIGKIWFDDKGLYQKEKTVLRELMGDKITESEHKQAMNDLEKFTKERQKEEKNKIVADIKESIPKPSNVKKAKERLKETEEDTQKKEKPKYTEEQRKVLKTILILIHKKSLPATAIYTTYNENVKDTLNYFLEHTDSMKVEEIQKYLIKDYTYQALIGYIRDTTDIDLSRVIAE